MIRYQIEVDASPFFFAKHELGPLQHTHHALSVNWILWVCSELWLDIGGKFPGSGIVFWAITDQGTGGRLNKKDGLTRYGDSHVKDKTS